MMPMKRYHQSWLPAMFDDFFDNEWMKKTNATAPAINVIENDKEYKVEDKVIKNVKEALQGAEDIIAEQVSDDDATRLAKKNGMNYTYSICVYPMTIIPDQMKKRSISEQSRLAFESYLKKIFKELDICVIPKLIHIEEVELREEELANIGEEYFKTGKINSLSRWKQDNVDKEQIDLYGFPIVFREAHDRMTFSVVNDMGNDEYFLKREMNEIAFTKEAFEMLGIEINPILDSDELKLIKKDLNISREPKDNFLEFLVGSWEIEEHYAMFLEEYNNVLQTVAASMKTIDMSGIGPNRWRF